MDPAGPHEQVAIGLNEKSKQDGVPKAKVKNFKPRPCEGGRLELSSFCIDELQDPSIWELLDKHLNKPAIGRSDLGLEGVSGVGLQADPDWDPERHVNLLGWPPEEEHQTAIAQKLYGIQSYSKRPARVE